MARHLDALVFGAALLAACNGAAALAVDGGQDGPSTLDSGFDARVADGRGPEASDGGPSDAVSETAAAFCALFLDSSDPATVCGFTHCCQALFTCQASPACGDYDYCITNTPLDAAPPDADSEGWVVQYCLGQFPEGGAQSLAGTSCAETYCGDSGLGM
jgi:hypothetical protein